VGTGDVLAYCSAMQPLDPSDLADLYWAGRVTLVSRREDIGAYDETFRRFFLNEGSPAASQLLLRAAAAADAQPPLVMPGTEPGPEQEYMLRTTGASVPPRPRPSSPVLPALPPARVRARCRA
jgi:uncharacterized protein